MARGRYERALEAWQRGDAAAALALCASDAAPFGLLRARALLRLRRTREAIELLESRPWAGNAAEAAMLLGTAYVRGGNIERGLETLHDAERLTPAPSSALRSEIALGIALAHYQRRDFTQALAALDTIPSESGAAYAHALEYRGWIAKSANDLPRAIEAFEAALTAHAGSGERNVSLEANILATLAYLAVEQLDMDRWQIVLERTRAIDWESPGLAYNRFWLAMTASMADEIGGRPRAALEAARAAGEAAPSPAFSLFAQCRRATVLFSYGELLGYEDLAGAIGEEFAAIDLRLLHEFEELNLAVVVAETLALIGDAEAATLALRKLDRLTQPQLALLHDEPAKRAYLSFVEGLVADAGKDAFRAQHRYRAALRAFEAIGMTRRALLCALRLAELNGDAYAVAFVQKTAPRLPATSWVRRHAARLSGWHTDAVLSQLTRAEREVLRLLYEGRSTAEIAESRGRSAQTIRNAVSRLFRTFGVDNRQALVKECAARGLFAAPDGAD